MSFDVKKFLSQFGLSKETRVNQGLDLNDPEFDITEEDILDLSQINFDNDETWLYERTECPKMSVGASVPVTHLTESTTDQYIKKFSKDAITKESNLKNINTQTFTRPKKKFLRPSIEKYNQELFDDNNEIMNLSSSSESPNITDATITKDYLQRKPLEFDLTQSMGSYHFEKIAANANSEDCFQSMSPPSLVNSLCSSTFTNLMESSYIKNDPVLKQICDTDFTTSILSQGSEPPSLIQSLCYSTNSVEEFLTKVSLDETVKYSDLNGVETMSSGDASFILHKKDGCEQEKNTPNIMDLEEYHDASDTNFAERPNGTYRKNRLSGATFRKTDLNRTTTRRNQTFEIDPKDVEEAYNATLTIESPKSTRTVIMKGFNENLQKSNSMENIKNITIIKDSCNNDLNRYDSKENDLGSNKGDPKKSLDCSIGSADSLDRMSTLSSSSKGSNKMLNMEEVEAIAEKQEQSLQVMSTPKPNWSNKVMNRMLWDHSFVSPIEVQSDSGESSDEYKSVKSSFSKHSLESNPVKQTRSLVSLQDPTNSRKLKSINTVVNQANLLKGSLRGSASNLTKVDIPPSRMLQSRVGSAGAVNSNLITMRPGLRGSYTSLKPVNTHLPVAPPINATPQGNNATYLSSVKATVEIQAARNVRHEGVDKNSIKMSGDGVFLKPSIPIRSGLPRPTSATSIPRPVSKIPGPRRFAIQKHDPSKIGT